MIRATVHFDLPGGGTEGWLCMFEQLPQIGSKIVLRSHEGDHIHEGRVKDVRHLLFGQNIEAGAEMVEIDLEPAGVKKHVYFESWDNFSYIDLELLDGERIISIEQLANARQVWIQGTAQTAAERFKSRRDPQPT